MALVGIFLAGFLLPAEAAPLAWVDNGVTWGGPSQTVSGYYRPGDYIGSPGVYDNYPAVAPTTPTWFTGSSGGIPTLNTSQNYLNITTTTTGDLLAYAAGALTGNTTWNASVAATVEFTLRINSMASGAVFAGNVQLGNAVEQFTLGLGVHGSGDLSIHGVRAVGVPASQFNTIRLTLSEMESVGTSTLTVYLNNDPNPFSIYTTLTGIAFNNVRFGDSVGTIGGSVDWQSFKWFSGQAIVPVPEPSPLALLAGCAALSVVAVMRKRDSALA